MCQENNKLCQDKIAQLQMMDGFETQFQVGSTTKIFVAVLLLQMCEAGLLQLDDRVADWIPDYLYQVPGADVNTTLRQLAQVLPFVVYLWVCIYLYMPQS